MNYQDEMYKAMNEYADILRNGEIAGLDLLMKKIVYYFERLQR